MSSARFELDNVTKPSATDDEIIALAALALTENEPEVYRLGINHDVRAAACRTGKPRTGACPVEYDWAHRDMVGIETPHKHVAVHWAAMALRAGYTVRIVSKYHIDAIPGYSASVDRCRNRIAYANRVRNGPGDEDDDIPF
jgi:hypothetical protein